MSGSCASSSVNRSLKSIARCRFEKCASVEAIAVLLSFASISSADDVEATSPMDVPPERISVQVTGHLDVVKKLKPDAPSGSLDPFELTFATVEAGGK